MDVSQLTPRRPYLLRAFYDWLLDNQLTPHLVVDVTLPGVLVPMEYARDGQIVLNIAPRAVGNLELANDEVRFNARFGGVPRNVSVPLAAVLAIYAVRTALVRCSNRKRPMTKTSAASTMMTSRRRVKAKR